MGRYTDGWFWLDSLNAYHRGTLHFSEMGDDLLIRKGTMNAREAALQFYLVPNSSLDKL